METLRLPYRGLVRLPQPEEFQTLDLFQIAGFDCALTAAADHDFLFRHTGLRPVGVRRVSECLAIRLRALKAAGRGSVRREWRSFGLAERSAGCRRQRECGWCGAEHEPRPRQLLPPLFQGIWRRLVAGRGGECQRTRSGVSRRPATGEWATVPFFHVAHRRYGMDRPALDASLAVDDGAVGRAPWRRLEEEQDPDLWLAECWRELQYIEGWSESVGGEVR